MWTEHDIEANGLTMHYRRAGNGATPLVLVHGATDNGGCWGRVAASLGDRFAICAPDARGHGKSSAPIGDYSSTTMATDLAAFIGAIGIDQPLVMGHSMGANTTLALVAGWPELARAAVLEDPVFRLDASAEQEIEARRARMRAEFDRRQSETHAEIVAAGKDFNFGLEAGSKPELMIALAMHEGAQRLIICNGYKDHDYIRLALLGRKLGKRIIIVVEQLSELDDIIRLSAETGVKPMIGFRAKLQTRGEGKWATSTGDNAKFGLNTAEILFAVERLRAAKLTSALRLVHFHIGSQVPNILTIKNAVIEAARFYCQLARMGFPMGYLDVGGGLGIDYDGSRTNFESSMNYSLEEYARDVVVNIREVCAAAGVAAAGVANEPVSLPEFFAERRGREVGRSGEQGGAGVHAGVGGRLQGLRGALRVR